MQAGQPYFSLSLILLFLSRVAIESDVLYPLDEIRALGQLLPASEFYLVKSDEGHDGLLLEWEQINEAIVAFMQKHEPTRSLIAREGVTVAPKTAPRGSLFASW